MRKAAFAAILVGLVGCHGGGAVCGDGVVGGTERCDHGKSNGTPGDSCSATCQSITVPYPEISLAWSLLDMTGVAGYRGIGCADVGATQAHVHLDGPTTIDETLPCAMYGNMYARWCATRPDGGLSSCPYLAVGMYTASVQLLDDGGNAITKAAKSPATDVEIDMSGNATAISVSFAPGDFVRQDYTGKLIYRLNWGAAGGTCSSVSPTVSKQSVKLVKDGAAVPLMLVATPNGTKLDGTPAPCFTPMGDSYEEADGVPWGRYSLTARSGDGAWSTTQQVFVGPGIAPQTWDVIVPMTLPPDMAAPVDLSIPVDGGTGG